MKNTILSIAVILLTFTCAQSQNLGVVAEKKVEFQKDVRPAFSVVMETSDDFLLKEWKSYLKIAGVSVKKSKGIWSSESVFVKAIDEGSLIIHSIINSDEKGARLDVFFARNADSFISSSTDASTAASAKAFVEKFAKEHIIKAYNHELERERKVADGIAKDHGKLIKQKDGYASDIEKYKGQISSSEESIISTEQKVREMENKIIELKSKIQDLKGKTSQAEKNKAGIEKKIAESQVMIEEQNVKVERVKAKLDVNQ